MSTQIQILKYRVNRLLGKHKGRGKPKNEAEREKLKRRMTTKYPQMYRKGSLSGTKSIMAGVRRMDPSSMKGVGKSRTAVLKKKYGGK